MVDCAVGHQPRPVTEVVRPPPQHAIQAIAHLGPRCDILAHQQVSHFLPQPSNALLRRTRPEICVTILPKTMRPEAVSQKIKPLSPCLLDAGLRLVQRESNPGHHTPRPIQCLCRAAATENHEIIGVVDHLGSEHLTPPGDPPVLQKTVHVQVGEQGTDDAALWSSTGASLPPLTRGVPFSSRSSTGTFNHILIRRSMSRSTILRATHCISSECGMVSKYFDRSASTTSA